MILANVSNAVNFQSRICCAVRPRCYVAPPLLCSYAFKQMQKGQAMYPDN